jgi:hypothetical protein
MGLSSSTYALAKVSRAKADAKKNGLLARHRQAVDKVLADAKALSEDRKRDLNQIADDGLRQSAAR